MCPGIIISFLYIMILQVLFDTDVDECLEGTNDCEQTCINTPGTFICSCSDGYTGTGKYCLGMLIIRVIYTVVSD